MYILTNDDVLVGYEFSSRFHESISDAIEYDCNKFLRHSVSGSTDKDFFEYAKDCYICEVKILGDIKIQNDGFGNEIFFTDKLKVTNWWSLNEIEHN